MNLTELYCFFSTITIRIFVVAEKYIIFALDLCAHKQNGPHFCGLWFRKEKQKRKTVIVTNKLF